MKDEEIARKLHAYYKARDYSLETKEHATKLHIELMQIAVELGANQKDVLESGSAKYFIDGYLVAKGIVQPSRKEAAK